MVCFNNLDEMRAFLERAGIIIEVPKTDKHYLIIGAYTGTPIGCTSDVIDALFEEPEASFVEVAYDLCPIHNGEE